MAVKVQCYAGLWSDQRFGRPCCNHLQGEGNGAGKKGIYIGLECRRGQSLAASDASGRRE